MASGISACRNVAIVGQTESTDAGVSDGTGVTDSTASDAAAGDASLDAVVTDSGADANPDGGVDANPDGSIDANPDGGGGAGCPRPWAMVVAHTSSETRVERFSFSTGDPVRCSTLRAEGLLGRTSRDVAALDDSLVAVVSPTEVVAINIADDTVRWRKTVAVFDDLQAFALRTSPPWLGIQSHRSGSSSPSLIGIDVDGTLEREWTSRPSNSEGISAYPESPWVIGGNRFTTLNVFDPFSGTVSQAIDISHSQTWYLHVAATSPPGISFGGRGIPIVSGQLGTDLVRHTLSGCQPQQSAPSPVASNKILVVCGTGVSASLRLYDGESPTLLLSADAAEPDLELSGLGLAP